MTIIGCYSKKYNQKKNKLLGKYQLKKLKHLKEVYFEEVSKIVKKKEVVICTNVHKRSYHC